MVFRALINALHLRARPTQELVPGRECGTCTACCTHLKIDTPELQKFAGTDCEHLLPQRGCGIYERRPPICRGFHCAWRQLRAMPEDWRPDRSGVLVVVTSEGVPPGYAATFGLSVSFIRQPAPIRHPSVVHGISAFVNAGIPVFMQVNGAPGRVAKKTLLNESLRRAMQERGPDVVADHLVTVFQALEREPKEALVLKYHRTPPRPPSS